MSLPTSKSLKGKMYSSPDALRWAYRNRVIELQNYKAAAYEAGVPLDTMRRIAGKGLTRLQGPGERDGSI
jgi:hypothetical protein